jgi:peptidoglycan hydrolase CwlO-like protein
MLGSQVSIGNLLTLITVAGQLLAIYAVLHNRNNESHDKDSKMIENFTRIEVKLDSYNRRIDSIEKTVEKSDAKLDDINNHMTRTDERVNGLHEVVNDLRKRVESLEGRK